MAVVVAGMRPIAEVAEEVGLRQDELRHYGAHIAKITLDALARRRAGADGTVVLVTSINPTPAGEGKTVTAIGLAQALRALGRPAIVCLREPSMGPVFGLKGGATGGGRCTVEPSAEIDLHFTGDLHAVTAANNLLASLLDEHLFRGRLPVIDVRRPLFHRVLDVNDRALRDAVIGLGGGVPREEQFEITAASEVMAVLGLAADHDDLRRRLGRIIAGMTREDRPVTAEDLRAAGAMAALLRDALLPNLVQTREGGPAFVHTGPFANIAHGTSSLVSLRLAQKLSEYVVIEAGFGADLGAEKFVNLLGAAGGPHPRVAVIVATARALKYHGGVHMDHLRDANREALHAGLPLLRRHVDIVRRLGMRPVVCVNAFSGDSGDEIDAICAAARSWVVPVTVSHAYAEGGAGARALANLVREACAVPGGASAGPLYDAELELADKIAFIAREIYGAAGVGFSEMARRHLEEVSAWGFRRLPICMAKTQYSLTDQPHIRGVPGAFTLQIRDVSVRAGAGFVLALTGEMLTMPALPPHPRAWEVDLDSDGTIRWPPA
jgi:formate--tetrahydrofolate ligase